MDAPFWKDTSRVEELARSHAPSAGGDDRRWTIVESMLAAEVGQAYTDGYNDGHDDGLDGHKPEAEAGYELWLLETERIAAQVAAVTAGQES